jgi:hypothetical protein
MAQESEFYINDIDWAQKLQYDVEQYTDGLFESIDADDDENYETVTGQPFCGCNTCLWREALAFVTPRILRAASAGQVELVEKDFHNDSPNS